MLFQWPGEKTVLDDHNALSFSPEMSSVKLQWQYYRCPRVVNKVVPPNASCCGRRLLEPLNSALHWYPARPLWAVCVLTLSWPLRQRWGFKFLTADILEAPDRHSLSLSVRSPPQGPTLIAPVGKHIGLWAPCLPCFPSLTSHPSYSAQPGWGRMRSQPLKAVLTKMSLEKLSARRPLYRDAGHGMGHIGQWAWPLNPGNASLGWWLLWVLLVHLQYQSCPPPPTSCSKKSSLMTPAIFHCRDRSANNVRAKSTQRKVVWGAELPQIKVTTTLKLNAWTWGLRVEDQTGSAAICEQDHSLSTTPDFLGSHRTLLIDFF